MLQQVLARLFQMKELSKYFYRTLLQICILGHVELFLTPGTAACQVPLSMEFTRQECWSG